MKLDLAPATIEDSEEMVNLEKQSESKLFHAYTSSDEMDKYLSKSKIFFVVIDNIKVGAIGYEVSSEDSVQIQGLNLLPEFRGKRIAIQVVKDLLKMITNEGYKEAILYVHPENTPALITYLKSGFLIKGWKKNYFGDGEPRLEMKKTLYINLVR